MDKLYKRSQRNDLYKSTNAILLNSGGTHLMQWLPSGKLEGCEFVALNPLRLDNNAGSFRINIQTGKWADFATLDKGGDLISLYAYLNKCSQSKALKRLRNSIHGGCNGNK